MYIIGRIIEEGFISVTLARATKAMLSDACRYIANQA